MLAAVLPCQADQEVVGFELLAIAELDGIDAGAVIQMRDVGQLLRGHARLVGIGEKEDHVGRQAQRLIQGLFVTRGPVGRDAAHEFLARYLFLSVPKTSRPATPVGVKMCGFSL